MSRQGILVVDVIDGQVFGVVLSDSGVHAGFVGRKRRLFINDSTVPKIIDFLA